MYPLVGFAFQAQEYVSKGRRFLSDAPFGRFLWSLARRLPKILRRLFSFTSLLKFLSKNVRFGRTVAQLSLAALWLYLFEVTDCAEGPLLSNAPFGGFA